VTGTVLYGFNLDVAIHCFGTMLRLKVSKNVSVSALQRLGLGLVSWQKSDASVSHLVELQEGLGLGLVLDQKPTNVSAS